MTNSIIIGLKYFKDEIVALGHKGDVYIYGISNERKQLEIRLNRKIDKVILCSGISAFDISKNEVLIGCEKGSIIKVDLEKETIQDLETPNEEKKVSSLVRIDDEYKISSTENGKLFFYKGSKIINTF